MFDKHKRPYHNQLFANSGIHARGAHLDTFELEFDRALTDEDRDKVRQIAEKYVKGKLDGFGAPCDERVTLEVPEGHYRVSELIEQLASGGFAVIDLKFYYSARLNEVRHPAPEPGRFDKDRRRQLRRK